jgi:hypothetical protein
MNDKSSKRLSSKIDSSVTDILDRNSDDYSLEILEKVSNHTNRLVEDSILANEITALSSRLTDLENRVLHQENNDNLNGFSWNEGDTGTVTLSNPTRIAIKSQELGYDEELFSYYRKTRFSKMSGVTHGETVVSERIPNLFQFCCIIDDPVYPDLDPRYTSVPVKDGFMDYIPVIKLKSSSAVDNTATFVFDYYVRGSTDIATNLQYFSKEGEVERNLVPGEIEWEFAGNTFYSEILLRNETYVSGFNNMTASVTGINGVSFEVVLVNGVVQLDCIVNAEITLTADAITSTMVEFTPTRFSFVSSWHTPENAYVKPGRLFTKEWHSTEKLFDIGGDDGVIIPGTATFTTPSTFSTRFDYLSPHNGQATPINFSIDYITLSNRLTAVEESLADLLTEDDKLELAFDRAIASKKGFKDKLMVLFTKYLSKAASGLLSKMNEEISTILTFTVVGPLIVGVLEKAELYYVDKYFEYGLAHPDLPYSTTVTRITAVFLQSILDEVEALRKTLVSKVVGGKWLVNRLITFMRRVQKMTVDPTIDMSFMTPKLYYVTRPIGVMSKILPKLQDTVLHMFYEDVQETDLYPGHAFLIGIFPYWDGEVPKVHGIELSIANYNAGGESISALFSETPLVGWQVFEGLIVNEQWDWGDYDLMSQLHGSGSRIQAVGVPALDAGHMYAMIRAMESYAPRYNLLKNNCQTMAQQLLIYMTTGDKPKWFSTDITNIEFSRWLFESTYYDSVDGIAEVRSALE